LIPNQPPCVYDSGEWKGCVFGNEPKDFVKVIQSEWEKLNPSSSGNLEMEPTKVSHLLAKRQSPSVTPSPATESAGGGGGRPTTPLSVFVSRISLELSKDEWGWRFGELKRGGRGTGYSYHLLLSALELWSEWRLISLRCRE